ncbi:PspC domain-containing protein [Aestuariimicrobium soli]|uniref:PspC domain-containing protein n=1 Tax=Aestuariimicrobium soli TaxID=2035834 RepID=UPI003EB7C2BA
MTETPTTDLVRHPRSSEGQLAGVCAALGERWRVDPLLIRTAMVLATLSGGVGAVIYGVLWLFMPPADGGRSRIEQWLPAWRSWSTARVTVLIIVASVVMLALTAAFTPFGVGPLIVLGLLVFIGRRHVAHQRAAQQPTQLLPPSGYATPAPGMLPPAQGWRPAPPLTRAPITQTPITQTQGGRPQPMVTGAPATEFGQAVQAWQSRLQQVQHGGTQRPGVAPAAFVGHAPQGRPLPAPAPAPTATPMAAAAPVATPLRRRGPRPSWWGGLVTAGLATGAFLILDHTAPGRPVLALGAALAVIGLALVIGSVVGRPRLMIAVGLIASLMMAPLSVSPGDRQGPGAQSLSWSQEADLHDLSLVGQTWNVDLTGLTLSEDRTVTIDARSSAVSVKVSPDQPVTVIYTSRASGMVVDHQGSDPGGTGGSGAGSGKVERGTVGDHSDTVTMGPTSGPRLTLVIHLTWSAGAVHTS